MNQVREANALGYQQPLKLLYSLLYYNLGGEMMYILNQRLIAQNVNSIKSSQVISEILNSLISHRPRSAEFHNFGSYEDLNLRKVKNVFQEVLEASSSMRLTSASFDKLFDLMAGVFKYQLVLCPFPSSLYRVTLNHLDSVRELTRNLDEKTTNRYSGYCDSFTKAFDYLSEQQWFLLRSVLLSNVFASIRTRISVLLKEGLQDIETGSYTIVVRDEQCITQVHYDEDGNVMKKVTHPSDHSSDSTKLGLDIYCRESNANAQDAKLEETFAKLQMKEPEETKLLASLLGRDKATLGDASSVLLLDLSFSNVISDTDSNADEAGSQVADKRDINNQEIHLEATRRIQPAGLDEDEIESTAAASQSSEDLLALMDS